MTDEAWKRCEQMNGKVLGGWGRVGGLLVRALGETLNPLAWSWTASSCQRSSLLIRGGGVETAAWGEISGDICQPVQHTLITTPAIALHTALARHKERTLYSPVAAEQYSNRRQNQIFYSEVFDQRMEACRIGLHNMNRISGLRFYCLYWNCKAFQYIKGSMVSLF